MLPLLQASTRRAAAGARLAESAAAAAAARALMSYSRDKPHQQQSRHLRCQEQELVTQFCLAHARAQHAKAPAWTKRVHGEEEDK
jgi:hypothetical protein